MHKHLIVTSCILVVVVLSGCPDTGILDGATNAHNTSSSSAGTTETPTSTGAAEMGTSMSLDPTTENPTASGGVASMESTEVDSSTIDATSELSSTGSTGPDMPVAICGDNDQTGDECDDLNCIKKDGCTFEEIKESKCYYAFTECSPTGCKCPLTGCSGCIPATCGDGAINTSKMMEECDDGPQLDGSYDGCDNCHHELIAFVTRDVFGVGSDSKPDKTFNSVEAADDRCQEAADEASLTGEYKAWLSDETSKPSLWTWPEGKPVYRRDGEPIAASGKDLFTTEDNGSIALMRPINIDEHNMQVNIDDNNQQINNVHAWTGTDKKASLAGTEYYTCALWDKITAPMDNYTGVVGDVAAVDEKWTNHNLKTAQPCITSIACGPILLRNDASRNHA